MAAPTPHFRFGVFEFHPDSAELFLRGRKVRLQSQPSRVLSLLIQRAGGIVTREELRRSLWPEDTFVDFDNGLNKAINGLRVILRDRASKPRFIETLPRKGYRFTAPIEQVHTARGSNRHIKSLAVLPLANQSGDPAQEYFADGMTEELISAISRIQSLRVISRTSVMLYKGSRKSLSTIAKELRVDGVIEGSVARSGTKVRITAQLIYTPNDEHIWSGRYEREMGDILRLQAEIAESIAYQIDSHIDLANRPGAVRSVHPQAYEAYLKGTLLRDRMTPADLEKSIHSLLQAIELDPVYPQAFAALAQSYFFQGVFGILRPAEVFPKAKAAAERALELDESTTAAHNALASVHILYEWDWARAEAECRRAIQLNPCEPVARVHLADYMSIRGRHDEAVAEFRRALAMDPVSRVYLGHFGLILYRARRYDESIEQCKKALDIDPNYGNALWFLALAQEKKGELPASIALLEKAVAVSEGGLHYRALLGRAFGIAGDRQKAGAILEQLHYLSDQRYVSPFDIALVYLGLGESTSVYRYLDEAYRQRVFRLVELTLPMFDDLRQDRRWSGLVERIGLSATHD